MALGVYVALCKIGLRWVQVSGEKRVKTFMIILNVEIAEISRSMQHMS